MKKQVLNLLSIILCLCLVAGCLTACGGGEKTDDKKTTASKEDETETTTGKIDETEQTTEEETKVETTEATTEETTEEETENEYADIELVNTSWLVEGFSYQFYENDIFMVEVNDDQYAVGDYEWDGQSGIARIDDESVMLKNEGDAGMFIETTDGEQILMEFDYAIEITEEETDLSNTKWVLDEIYYIFYADGTMEVESYGESVEGSYEWDGTSGLIDIEDSLYEIFFLAMNFYVEAEDSSYYCMGYLGTVEDRPNETNIVLADTIWSIDDITYVFYADGTVTASDGDISESATYEWYEEDGEGYIETEEDIIDIYMEDNALYMENEDGEDYLMTYVGVNGSDPGSAGKDEESTEHSGEGWKLVEHPDGTSDYWDYNRNVSFTFPTWMTVILEGIGENTDATIVGDNKGGYLLADNLTNEWADYGGTHDEFLYNYMDSYLYELFTPLYGEWEDNTHEIFDVNENGILATFSGNFWNDTHDVQVEVSFYITEDGSAMIKCAFFDYEDWDQYQALWDGITDVTGI